MDFSKTTQLTTRRLIATIQSSLTGENPLAIAQRRWRGDPPITTRSGVAGGVVLDWSTAATPEEFFDAVVEDSVLGRINCRRVPFQVRFGEPNLTATAHWIGEGRPLPLSRTSIQGSSLDRLKTSGLIVISREALDAHSYLAERVIEADLRRALVQLVDETFLNPGNAGVAGESPASVTYGTTPLQSSGNPTTDLGRLIEDFGGDLATAAFVTHPVTAGEIALWRDSAGSAPFIDCGPAGGTLLGLPLVTTRHMPRDTGGSSVVLIDGQGIAAAWAEFELLRSEDVTIEMADDPTGEANTPTAQSKQMVSMFQAGMVAALARLCANWQVVRPGSVAVIENAAY